MGSKRSRINQKRRRKFIKNQYSEKSTENCPSTTVEEARPSPMQNLDDEGPAETRVEQAADFFFFMQYSCLKAIFLSMVTCPNTQCPGDIDIGIDIEKKQGLWNFIIVNCELCGFTSSDFTSKKTLKKCEIGPKFFEVNLRATLAFKELGKGHEAMTTFCTVMNMPSLLSKTSFDNCTDEVHRAFNEEAKCSLMRASKDTASKCQLSGDGKFSKCTVTIDGTWQTRGYRGKLSKWNCSRSSAGIPKVHRL